MIIINKIKINDCCEAKYIYKNSIIIQFFITGNFYYNRAFIGCMGFVNDKNK